MKQLLKTVESGIQANNIGSPYPCSNAMLWVFLHSLPAGAEPSLSLMWHQADKHKSGLSEVSKVNELLLWIICVLQRTRKPCEAKQAASPGADPVSSFPSVGSGPGPWNSLLWHRVALPAPVLQPWYRLTEPQTNRSVVRKASGFCCGCSFW